MGKGWQTLPLGCGGLITGFDIAPDGTMVCRTDVGNAYRFTGTTATVTDPAKQWTPLMTFDSLGPMYSPARCNIQRRIRTCHRSHTELANVRSIPERPRRELHVGALLLK